MDCIFCKIINGEIPSDKIYEDDNVVCFRDIAPKAPVHVLVVPKKHIPNIIEAAQDKEILNHVSSAIAQITKKLGVDKSGFRTVVNTGKDGGQTVDHLHFHILAGKTFGEDFG